MGCEHVLWLHSRCHPEAPIQVAVVPGCDRLLVVCGECDMTVGVYQLIEPIPSTLTCTTCQVGAPPRSQMS